MAFTPMTDDLDIISKYPDEPYEEEGFTSTAFKASFDQGAKLCKIAINRLVNELNTWTGALVNAATARGIGFLRSANVPADNVQDAIDNVQSQLVGITQGGVADGSITDAKVAADADVNGAKLKDASVSGAKLVSETLGNAHLPFGALAQDVTTSANVNTTGSFANILSEGSYVEFIYCKALGLVLVQGDIGFVADATSGYLTVNWSGLIPYTSNGYVPFNATVIGGSGDADAKAELQYMRTTMLTTKLIYVSVSNLTVGETYEARINGWFFCEDPGEE
jgi:hypothetical protein